MRFIDLLSMSLNNLRRRKLRTALTVLGVIIGTASIVVMLSLGIGLNELNRELISSYGSLTAIEVRSDSYWGGSDDKTEPLHITDETVQQMERIGHVSSVYPLLEVNVIMKQGKYTAGMSLTGAPLGYLEQIPLGQGKLPEPDDKELQLIFGNAVIQWFSDGKGRNNYWETGELPDIDFMNKPMFVIFDTDSYYQSQGEGEGDRKSVV